MKNLLRISLVSIIGSAILLNVSNAQNTENKAEVEDSIIKNYQDKFKALYGENAKVVGGRIIGEKTSIYDKFWVAYESLYWGTSDDRTTHVKGTYDKPAENSLASEFKEYDSQFKDDFNKLYKNGNDPKDALGQVAKEPTENQSVSQNNPTPEKGSLAEQYNTALETINAIEKVDKQIDTILYGNSGDGDEMSFSSGLKQLVDGEVLDEDKTAIVADVLKVVTDLQSSLNTNKSSQTNDRLKTSIGAIDTQISSALNQIQSTLKEDKGQQNNFESLKAQVETLEKAIGMGSSSAETDSSQTPNDSSNVVTQQLKDAQQALYGHKGSDNQIESGTAESPANNSIAANYKVAMNNLHTSLQNLTGQTDKIPNTTDMSDIQEVSAEKSVAKRYDNAMHTLFSKMDTKDTKNPQGDESYIVTEDGSLLVALDSLAEKYKELAEALYGKTTNEQGTEIPGSAENPQEGSLADKYNKEVKEHHGVTNASSNTNPNKQHEQDNTMVQGADNISMPQQDTKKQVDDSKNDLVGENNTAQNSNHTKKDPEISESKNVATKDDSYGKSDNSPNMQENISNEEKEHQAKETIDSVATDIKQVSHKLAQTIATQSSHLSDMVEQASMTAKGVQDMQQQMSALSSAVDTLSQTSFSNLSKLSDSLKAVEKSQVTLSGYLNGSSASVGQLRDSTQETLKTINGALKEVDLQLSKLDSNSQAIPTMRFAVKSSASTNPSDSSTSTQKDLLTSLKTTLTNQKNALLSVQKNVNMAIASAKKTTVATVTNTNNHGQMYGVNVIAGYKHFFGKKKRWGFRTYAYYSFNHANLSFVGTQAGYMNGASQVNNHTYGVGFDALYNFYESKEGYNTAGIFFGFGLGGETWLVQGESHFKNMMNACNAMIGCSASMNTSYFQMPVQVGFRTNFAKHSGIELGFKVPLFVNQFYKERGEYGDVDVFYKRNFSMYLNYMINF
ncbi:outer membrane protein [Helicobacter cetorum]|uniref:outer membrane protein n=1 Tax=Helicobacter cetorum TaxID=138563 RepID=UPI001F212905|nr:outer membrane protein [Helicobacter cetorum]